MGDGVPASWIVFENPNNPCKSDYLLIKYIAMNLYLKYIQTGSEYEINISSHLRREFTRLIEDKENSWLPFDPNENDQCGQRFKMYQPQNVQENVIIFELNEVIELFDHCNKVNLRLMGGAFARFRVTHEFQRLTKFMFLEDEDTINIDHQQA